MKKVMMIIALTIITFPPLSAVADECLEGDCDNGIGKGFTDDGNIYDGAWRNGEPNGEGRLFLPKGKVIEGRWRNGELVEKDKPE